MGGAFTRVYDGYDMPYEVTLASTCPYIAPNALVWNLIMPHRSTPQASSRNQQLLDAIEQGIFGCLDRYRAYVRAMGIEWPGPDSEVGLALYSEERVCQRSLDIGTRSFSKSVDVLHCFRFEALRRKLMKLVDIW
eukprot:5592997-Amphidinium_carterae.1